MPRSGRIVIAGFPHHVVHRGHNRQVVFAEPQDYARYLQDMRELRRDLGIRIYGYCLMTNHIHLLLDPVDHPSAVAIFMKTMAGRTTRYRNGLDRRSGTLWESRYKSSVVQSDSYLLACCRYIELNPVRARMVAEPEEYRWSSARERLGLCPPDLLDPHPTYLALGASEQQRTQSYWEYLKTAIPSAEWTLIRESLQRGQLTGNQRFVDEIEQITGARVEHRKQGRPRKDKRTAPLGK